MGHIGRLPNATEVAPAALAAALSDTLREGVRPGLDARSRMADAV